MAPAGAAAVALAAAVCFLLVAPAPARRPAELPPQVVVLPPDAVEREAAAEPLLLPKPAADADADLTTTTALAVPEEEEERGPARPLSSLLCLVFRCDDSDEANAVAVRKSGDSQAGGWWPRPAGKGDDSDSDSDCESDSDDEEGGEGGIVGWFWSLAHRF